jgi:exonuclease SbcD
MRFIHTSDWHIGRSIRQRDRYEEARALLDEIGSYAEKEAIDFIVIAGDVFDHPTPAAEAEKLVYAFFCRMNRASIPIVIIAGNHDSYERFDSKSDLFAIANVNVFGTPKRDAVLSLETRKGETAKIGCLPYLSPRFLLRANEIFDLSDGEMKSTYSAKVAKAISMISRQFSPDAVNILVSHLFLQGSVPSCSERPVDITSAYAVSPPAIPPGAQYCCLGHIHKRQNLPRASAPAYYCGSIMKLDFGEEKDEKGFLVIDAKPDRTPAVDFIKLENVEPVMTVEIDFPDLTNRTDEIRKLFHRGYGKIRIRHTHPIPNLGEIVKHEIPEAVAWEMVFPEREEEKKAIRSLELSSLMDPVEMFSTYYKEEYEEEPPEEYIKTLRELYEESIREQEGQDS